MDIDAKHKLWLSLHAVYQTTRTGICFNFLGLHQQFLLDLFSSVHQRSPNSIQGHQIHLNALRPRQNDRYFADDIFKCVFLNENVWISIKIALKFVPMGPINNIPASVLIMAWRQPGDKPLSEPIMARLPTQKCVTRDQWFKGHGNNRPALNHNKPKQSTEIYIIPGMQFITTMDRHGPWFYSIFENVNVQSSDSNRGIFYGDSYINM